MNKQKTFCFDFVKDYTRYRFSFDAFVNEEDAKKIYTGLLNALYRSEVSCKHYLVVFNDRFFGYIQTYNASNVEYSAEYCYSGYCEHDWDAYSKDNNNMKQKEDWDYYFAIKVEPLIQSEDFFADVKKTDLTIVKRVKEEGFIVEKIIKQQGRIVKGDWFAKGYISFHFSYKANKTKKDDDKQDSISTLVHLEQDFRAKDFDTPVETVLPLEFDGIQYINTFTEYLNILINIDSFKTLDDIKRLISIKQLVK